MKEVEIDGKWWIHGAGQPPQFGTLAYDGGGELSLTVKIPEGISFQQAVAASPEEVTEAVPEVILGQDAHDKPVTLFGCFNIPSVSAGLTTYKISVLAAVQGLQFQSWIEQCIHAAALDIDLLHRWLGGKIVEMISLGDGREAWKVPELDDLVIEVCTGVQLRIVRFIAPSSTHDEYRFAPRPRIWLHFETAQSLDELTSTWVPSVTRLFSLLMGTTVHYHEIDCYMRDPYAEDFSGFPTEGRIIRKGSERKPTADVHIHAMLAPYPQIANSLTDIVQRWHQVASKFEPLVDLFSSVAFHQTLHCKAQFLALVQALEVYHARAFESSVLPTQEHIKRVNTIVAAVPTEFRDWAWRKLQAANFKQLDERLDEIFERHPVEARRLFSGWTNLSERIRYTRNHLTHYTGDIHSPKFLTDTEMVQVNWYMRAFIWACLLKEIGVSGRPIERLLNRQADVHFVNLN